MKTLRILAVLFALAVATAQQSAVPALTNDDLAVLQKTRITILEMEKRFSQIQANLRACSPETIKEWNDEAGEIRTRWEAATAAYVKERQAAAAKYEWGAGHEITDTLAVVKKQAAKTLPPASPDAEAAAATAAAAVAGKPPPKGEN